MVNNRKGVALLYVLMALVFVGAVGLLVLNMANKEKTDSGLRASSEAARSMATAGLTYATNYFSDPATDKSELIGLLNDWFKNKSDKKKWLAGGENSFTSQNENDGIRFRVEIVNMDFSQIGNNELNNPITVMFKSESIDASGSRAENFGTYDVFGFELEKQITTVVVPDAAFFSESGGHFFYAPITVNGYAYFKNGINEFFGNSIFNGIFRLDGGSSPMGITGATFNGPAFFSSGRVGKNGLASGTNVFNRGFGSFANIEYEWENVQFEVRNGNDAYIYGDFRNRGAYANAGIRFIGDNTGGTKGILYRPTVAASAGKLYDPANIHASGTANAPLRTERENLTPAQVMARLGIPDIPPCKPIINIPADWLNAPLITGAQTGAQLNNLTPNGPNGWIIRRTNGSNFATGGTGFTGKMVLIVEGTFHEGDNFFEVANTGNVFVYVRGNNILSMNTTNFRGMIYTSSNSTPWALNLRGANNLHLRGGVYSTGTGATRLLAGNRVEITYDKIPLEQMVKELVVGGQRVITMPDGCGGGEEEEGEAKLKRKNGVQVTTIMRGRGY